MIRLGLVILSIVAIGMASGWYWVLALALAILLPYGVDRLVLFIWAGIAMASLDVGAWYFVYVIVAVIDLFVIDEL